MLEQGRGAVHCNALIMAISDCSAAHGTRRSWLGTGQWAHLIMRFCLTSSNVQHDETMCGLCVVTVVSNWDHTYLLHPCRPAACAPHPRGPRQCITRPCGGPWLSPTPLQCSTVYTMFHGLNVHTGKVGPFWTTAA